MDKSQMPPELAAPNKITLDYIKYAEHIKEVFPKHFTKPKIRKFKGSREEIVDKLLQYNRRISAPRRVIQNIKSLSEPNTYAIITGQQPGLFTGPLYTVYKAVSAIILCERLSDRKKALVPIFWNASEDADLSEIDHITIFKQNKPFTILYEPQLIDVAFSHLHLDKESARTMLSAIDLASSHSEFKTKLIERINRLIDLSTTVADFFSRFMVHVFGKYGLIMIEPEVLRSSMIPIFQQLIRKPVECTRILTQTSARLKNLGYSAKIHKKHSSCNFFIISKEGKRLQVTYKRDAREFHWGNESFSKGEILTLLRDNPLAFSANAVTRPITQDFLLPTFGYVAGPNEIAYYAQLQGIYEFFSLEMPIIFPRFGATIVEKKISKVIGKYKARISEFKNPETLLKRLAGKKFEEVFTSLRQEVSRDMIRATKEAEAVDKSLVTSIQIARNKILRAIETLESKFASKIKENDLVTRQQVVKAYNNLFPNGNLQERQINVLEYLIKFGDRFLQTIHE
ncbi:MAG: bacillithiol biosynthesis cysteine-adding enzyme BshC, partial [Candidatus Bathyarchaeota archaeon]|nr:bacillithiol biosynthesis cysteine-adding enzyme BshC [Candidatus Bathyarchaeota archaeon]